MTSDISLVVHLQQGGGTIPPTWQWVTRLRIPYWKGDHPPHLVTVFLLFSSQVSPALPNCLCPAYAPRRPRECPVHYGMMKLRTTAESSLEVPEPEALDYPRADCSVSTHITFPHLGHDWPQWGGEPSAHGFSLWIPWLLDYLPLVSQLLEVPAVLPP